MPDPDPEIENRRRGGDIPPHSAGHGVQDEERLLEYLDGALTPGEDRAVEAHLANCPECQALCEQWRNLDLELAAGLSHASLSPSFRARVWQRIETQPDSVLARKRAQLRADWEADWSAHRRRFLRAQFPALLDKLGY